MELLGNSQSFLGSLLTVIVLFLVKTNFIDDILSEKVAAIKTQLSQLSLAVMSVELRFSLAEIKGSAEYKLIKKYDKNEELFSNELNLIHEDIKLFASKGEEYAKKNDLTIDLKRMDGIVDYTERFLSSLYTMFFVLVVFIYDEIFSAIGDNDFLFSSLVIFITLSYVFWICLWLNFFQKTSLKQIRVESKNHKERHYPKNICIYSLYYCMVLIAILLFSYFVTSFNKLILPVSIVIMSFFCAYKMVGLKCKIEYFDKVSMLVHFTILIIISILISIIIFIPLWMKLVSSQSYLIHGPLLMCKAAIFAFVLLNGIVLPFILPYFRSRLNHTTLANKIEKSRNDIKAESGRIQEKLKEICKKIPSPE